MSEEKKSKPPTAVLWNLQVRAVVEIPAVGAGKGVAVIDTERCSSEQLKKLEGRSLVLA